MSLQRAVTRRALLLRRYAPPTRRPWWQRVDWKLTDAEIADTTGLTREGVRRRRLSLELPESPRKNQHGTTRRIEEFVKRSAGLPVDVIAERLECSVESVRYVVRKLGVKLPRQTKWAWHTLTTGDWARLTNVEIAERLGTDRQAVANYRSAHNLPASPYAERGKRRN